MTTATHPPAGAVRAVEPEDERRGLVVALLALAAVATFVLLLWQGRGRTFFFDEWSFVLDRSVGGVDTLLERHNEHIAVLPAAVYRFFFEVFGLAPAWPARVVVALLHVGSALVVFSLARRRVGEAGALAAAVLLLGLGVAWQNTLWGFQIGFVGSVFFGLLAFEALDRGGRRGDLLACAALVLAVLSSSLGVPLALGVAVEQLWSRRARALWVPAVPVALYGVWYLAYGESSITSGGLSRATSWGVDAAAAAAGGLFGRGLDWGRPLLAVAVVLAVWGILRSGVTARLMGLLTAGAAFWFLTGAARFNEPPETSRYTSYGAAIVVLVAVELLRGRRLPRGAPTWIAVALVAVAALQGLRALSSGAGSLRANSNVIEARLAAAELVGERLPEGLQLAPEASPQLVAGPYVEAVKNNGGSPIGDDPRAVLRDAPPDAKAQADALLATVGLTFAPAARGSGTCARATGELVRRPPFVVEAGSAAVEIRARRFAPGFDAPPSGVAEPGSPVRVDAPADAAPEPYEVRLSAGAPFRVCDA